MILGSQDNGGKLPTRPAVPWESHHSRSLFFCEHALKAHRGSAAAGSATCAEGVKLVGALAMRTPETRRHETPYPSSWDTASYGVIATSSYYETPWW